ncbi:MAG: hypothetical protein BWX88_04510 [Planctomycetes bacterium ADurb.Bin126]|nr:MAG: hypothetical protein BWX88_04510 [Planctomycetes bacterium ADurb.Bin126]HOD80380.1 hypothetical protein [Phycisphaerae bacterium]HQL74390.1 hypothetical protein [Phycisphaerae bacterium]
MRHKLAILLTLSTFAAVPAKADEPARDKLPLVPTVTSLADLRKLDPILVHEGWQLRVGLADGGSEAIGWKLVYCLRTRTEQAKPGRCRGLRTGSSRIPIGPLQAQVNRGGLRRLEDMLLQHLEMAERIYLGAPARREEAVEELFCATVPLWPEGGELILLGPSDNKAMRNKPLARRDLPRMDRPYVWLPLLYDSEENDQDQARQIRADDPPPPCVINAHPRPAWPVQASYNPLYACSPKTPERYLLPERSLSGQLPPAGGYEWKYLHHGATPAASAPAPPPAAPPARPSDDTSYPIRLTLEKDHFVLASRGVLDLYEPHKRVLARWWVNGKAVEVPDHRDVMEEIKLVARLMRALAEGKRQPIRIPAALPPLLGKLAGGDIVRLQVMYAPGGFEERPGDHLSKATFGDADAYYPAFGPMLSNPLEFFATPAMIAAGHKAAKEQQEKK